MVNIGSQWFRTTAGQREGRGGGRGEGGGGVGRGRGWGQGARYPVANGDYFLKLARKLSDYWRISWQMVSIQFVKILL